jgi:hypothetical protein
MHEPEMATESGDDDPTLVIYVVWHPDSAVSGDFARAIFRNLCADPGVPNRRGSGIPVRFRTSVSGDGAPTPIPFGAAKHTAVFVLADDQLVAEPLWQEYVKELTDRAGTSDLVVGAATTNPLNVPEGLRTRQLIRLNLVRPEDRERELLNNVSVALCHLLDPHARRVRLFLSYAKRDGLAITGTLARRLRGDSRFNEFFEVVDIPEGAKPVSVIAERAWSGSILLAVQTDTYESREWCRLAVLAAKLRRIPIIVLDAVQVGETRSFPYIGNVPVVCWRGESSVPAVIGALLGEVLRDRYFPKQVRSICRQRGISMDHEVFTYPPELLSVLSHRIDAVAAGGTVGRYLYPDPPLGAEELLLLRQFDPDIVPVTPTVLRAT